jgi:hypothetical protein
MSTTPSGDAARRSRNCSEDAAGGNELLRVDHKRIGAVAANQPMLAKQPNVSRLAYRDGWRLRRLVRVGQASIPVERQRCYFVGAKAYQLEVEIECLEIAKLYLEQIIIPVGIQRQLVVGQHIGALLGL